MNIYCKWVYNGIQIYPIIQFKIFIYHIYILYVIYIYINFVFFVFCNILATHTHASNIGFTFT